MNIFILDTDPTTAAQYHCDKHVVKMILESAQMLSTAYQVSLLPSHHLSIQHFKGQKAITIYCKENFPQTQKLYSVSHLHHPCTQWTYQSIQNYQWHCQLALALCTEYTKRYLKTHKSQEIIQFLATLTPNLPNTTHTTPFAIAMKPEFKISTNPVTCYRHYYLKDKIRFAKWNHSPTPTWFTQQDPPALS